jgi:polyphosphate kinase
VNAVDHHARRHLDPRARCNSGSPHTSVVRRWRTDYTSLFAIASRNIPELRDPALTPVLPPRLVLDTCLFETIRAGDVLVHHPYESFDDSVERFITTAAGDSSTIAIKMTVYRVGDDTPFVRSLIRAAESGKQVARVIELKARFDEARNLHWAAELERAGAHVTVGNASLKTHAKVALVVRKDGDALRSYAHIGTGNYHANRAALYRRRSSDLRSCHHRRLKLPAAAITSSTVPTDRARRSTSRTT